MRISSFIALPLLLLIFMLSGSASFGQTDELNLAKYWKLRNRFLEHYVKIGPNQGESLPAGALVPGDCIDNVASDGTDPAKWQKTEYGKMHWGDGMIRHGHYLGLLATEYALKKKYNMDVSSTLNELYYALNAINRVDRMAEVELNHVYGTQFKENLNGFYLREDIPEDFCLNWKDNPMNFGCTNSAFYENNNVAKINDPEQNWYVKPKTSYQNVPSMDQMSSLMIGLALVHKLVDDAYIKPTSSDVGFSIVTEAKAIVQRIVSYTADRNWEIIDVNGWPVANGGGDLAFSAYPFVLAASRITGNPIKSYEDQFIRRITRYHPRYNSVQHCVTGFGVSGQQDKQAEACDHLTPSFFKPVLFVMNKRLYDGAVPGKLNNQNNSDYLDWIYGGKSRSIKISRVLWKNKFLNFMANVNLAFKKSDYPDKGGFLGGMASRNQTIIFNIGVTGGHWNSSLAHIFGNATENRELELINALLHDLSPKKPKGFYQTYLNGMPISGSFNLSGKNWTPNVEGPWYETKLKAENGWSSPHRWRHGTEEHIEREGIFNGLDYMLYHNLYYLIFGDDLPGFSNNAPCFCDLEQPNLVAGDSKDEELQEAYNAVNKKLSHVPMNSENAFATTFNLVQNEYEVGPKFPEYKEMGIAVTKYQTDDVYVQRGGSVHLETDMVVCTGKTLQVGKNSQLHLDNGELIVRAGATLEIEGEFNIAADTRIVLDPSSHIVLKNGAKMNVAKGATIFAAEVDIMPADPIIMKHNGAQISCEDDGMARYLQLFSKRISE